MKVMMELGNQIVNRVYEARVNCTIGGSVQRATENCDRSVRETWIRSKYVDKRFVRPLVESNGGASATVDEQGIGFRTPEEGSKALVSPVARRWSVRRLRRRPNSRSRQRAREAASLTEEQGNDVQGNDETATNAAAVSVLPTTTANQCGDGDGACLNAIDEDGTQSTKSGASSDGSLVVIGRDLVAGPMLKAELALSSDQESTGDEEEDASAENSDRNAADEDIANLNPNLLLYKSSAVHNLPVMCQALASGANKLWRNEADRKRTPLHQAVLSVRIPSFSVFSE